MKKYLLSVSVILLASVGINAQNLPVYVTAGSSGYQSITVSVNELSLDRVFSIYPNPVKSELNIKLNSDFDFNGAELTVQDIRGRVVLKESGVLFNQNTLKVNVSGLTAGIYTLYLKAGSKNISAYKKFVITDK